MDEPKVTVLMAVHNGDKYLREAVDSILAQKFRDFEFLIVDDGSTDGTAEVLGRYSDPRIRIVTNEENIGLTKSLNKGLGLARGEYVARIDADDYAYPERLERQVSYLEENEGVGLLGTNAVFMDEGGRIISPFYGQEVPKDVGGLLIKHNMFCHSSVMLRKGCLKEAGWYSEDLPYAQDYDLWLRISEKCDVTVLDETLCRNRVTPESISVRKRHLQVWCEKIARDRALARRGLAQEGVQSPDTIAQTEVSARQLSENYFEVGRKYGWSSGSSTLLKYLVRAVRLDPTNPKPWIYLIASPLRLAWYILRCVRHRRRIIL